MSNYDALIDRVGAAGDVPEQFAEVITGDVNTESIALRLGRKVPTTTRDSRIPILSAVPDAWFVAGDNGMKRVTEATFDSTPLVAEEIACLVVIPDNVIADSEFGLWEALRPLVARAFARRLDRTILFGDGKPASWPVGLYQAALVAGQYVSESPSQVGDVELILAAAAELSEKDVNPTAVVVRPGYQYRISAVRSDAYTGSPVNAGVAGPLMIADLPVVTRPPYSDKTAATAIVADWDSVLIGTRQDLRFEFSNSAVITDDDGNVVRNLWQTDSTSMRVTMRVGYRLATPPNGAGTAVTPVSVVAPTSALS